MAGYYVPRKAGWDTHGLPVEVEVEKELGIHGKEAIEQYGVEQFISKCMDSVFRYTEEWEKMTRRVGFWVDLSDAYVTYHKSYIESVWWALSKTVSNRIFFTRDTRLSGGGRRVVLLCPPVKSGLATKVSKTLLFTLACHLSIIPTHRYWYGQQPPGHYQPTNMLQCDLITNTWRSGQATAA